MFGYQEFLRKHHVQIEMVQDVVENVVFWLTPAPIATTMDEDDGGRLREVLYGLLSLNRLAMDAALDHPTADDAPNPFGATLRPKQRVGTSQQQQQQHYRILRVILAVLQCLTPTVLELAGSSRTNHHRDQSKRRMSQMKLRVTLERIKFVLRFYLMTSYWRQMIQQQRKQRQEGTAMELGLLRDGGQYSPGESSAVTANEAWTLDQQQAYRRRVDYCGARTGRRIVRDGVAQQQRRQDEQRQRRANPTLIPSLPTIMASEVLHLVRPLHWAVAEYWNFHGIPSQTNDGIDETAQLAAATHNPFSSSITKDWIINVAIELMSLFMIRQLRNSPNKANRDEWNRRRVRMFLILLRSPIWDRLSRPTLARVLDILRKVPLLGQYLEGYLVAYVLYLKHPSVAEDD